MKNYDELCSQKVTEDRNMAVPWFLIAAYAYEQLGTSLISDELFDILSEQIATNYESLTHRHKALCYHPDETPGERISTAMGLKYPNIVVNAAHTLVKELNNATNL